MLVKHRLINFVLSQLVLLVVLAACGQPASLDPATATTMPASPAQMDNPPSSTPAPPTSTPAATTTTPEAPTATLVPPTTTPAPDEVIVIEDVLYAMAIDPVAADQYLDIYAPGAPGQYPPVIWAHGSDQDKSTGKSLGRILAKEGFVVLSIDWQDGSKSNDVDNVPRLFREVIESGACALSFVADQAEEHGADPGGVIWAGFSAGSYFGSLLAFTDGDYQVDWSSLTSENGGPPNPQIECVSETEPAPIIAYVSNSGGFPELLWYDNVESQEIPAEFMTLRHWVAIGKNPYLKVRLIHGSFDVTTPFEDAERFYDALLEAGYDVAFFEEMGGHLPFLQQVIDQILLLVKE